MAASPKSHSKLPKPYTRNPKPSCAQQGMAGRDLNSSLAMLSEGPPIDSLMRTPKDYPRLPIRLRGYGV